MACLVGVLAACREPPRPNLLLITLDTTRADRLGAYGHGPAQTPNLDRLAAEGVLFADATTVAPVTLPSHATILTGLLPPSHGVRDNGNFALGADAVTLAERLQDAGWQTHAAVSALVLNRRYNLTQGFAGYDDDLWSSDEAKLFMIRDRPAPTTAARAVAWLEEWASGAGAAEPADPTAGARESVAGGRPPFFLWVHFFDAHQPYAARPDVALRAASPYDAEVTMADEGVGLLLAALDRLEVADDTLVVVTADHGESLGEHGEKTHAVFVYDATIRVPLIWRFPRELPSGRVTQAPAGTVDVVPTVLALFGLPGGEQTEGRDLSPVLHGRRAPVLEGRSRYAESLVAELGFGMAPLTSIRVQGWKLIRAPRPELYDLVRDPGELTDLYTREPRRAQRLERELDRVVAASSARALAPQQGVMDRETLDMLQALGYLAPATDRAALSGLDPKDGLAMYNRLEDARHLAQDGRWLDAERELRALLADLPRNVSARNVLALALLRTGRREEAREEYLRSLADDPRQARVYSLLGALAIEDGRMDEARRLLGEALAISPGFVEAIGNLGLLAALEGNIEGAEAHYRQAIASDPGFPRVWRRLGDLLFERSDWVGALAAYERTLAAEPGDFAALIQAGNSARRNGDATAAAGWFARAAAVRPDSWIPAYNTACLAASTGDLEEALRQLALALDHPTGPSRELLDGDPDLAALRLHAEWSALRLAARPAADRRAGRTGA